MTREEIVAKINQRRRQIAVHSVIYYRFNDNIIDDHTYDRWSKELAELQKAFPYYSAEVDMYDRFKDFDGSTGYHLIDIPWAVGKAEQLLRLHKERKNNGKY